MNIPQTCDSNRLDAFVRGQLSEQQESELTAHLDQCASCGEELERRVAAADQWREAGELLTHRTRRFNVMDVANDPSTGGCFATSNTFAEQMDLVVGMLAPTDDPEMLGRIGGYEVSGVIGCGGMGVVFKAHDRSLDRVVAIKVMAPHLAGSGAARKRFARESKAAAAVLHPNVIAIHCVADDPKLPYLVMPYIGGASLQKRIEADGPLCTQDTLRIGQQIAAGLAAAHAQGLVHRDIKPANILLERGVERVTITDFGLARAVDDATMTRSGVIAGTPQYMSPEQARGESIDHRSDLFSLGSVLYMMCTGHSPFRAETTFGILRRITDNQPRSLREINPDVPEWLCAIIEKLHAKEPSERFQSAEEVAQLLERCLAYLQQPTTTSLPAPVAKLVKSFDSASSDTRSVGDFRYPPIAKYIAAACGAFALFFAGVLIVLELDKGTLTIESELDDVPIRIMQGENIVKQLTVTKSGKSVRVAAGTYQIEIAGEFPQVTVENGIVSMKRGETETVTIAMTPPSTANTKGEPMSSDSSPASTRLLADVIRQFNEIQRADPVGSKQPLLTDDEVIAAVRAMSHEIASMNVKESNYKVLRDAIERGQLPKEWTVESSNHFKLSDGRFGERWTVQLSLRQGESSPQTYVFRSRYVMIEPETSASKLPMPEGSVSIEEWLAKVNAPDPKIYATLPDLPVTEQEIVAALSDLIDKDQSIEFAPQRKTLQEIIETRSLPKEAEISVFRPQRLRGYVSRWSNREGFENENWTLRFEYPYTQDGTQIVTAVHLGFRSISSRPVDHVTDDEIHWGPAAQDGLQFGVAIEEVTLPDESDLASTGAKAYKPHFYFRDPSKTDSKSIQLSDMYQHYEIDARTATGEQLPSKRRHGSYRISSMIFPDTLNGESRIYKRACPFVVGNYAQTLFEDSLSLEPPDGQSFENFPSLAVNAPRDTPLRIRIAIPHPLFSDSARLLSGEIRLPPLTLTQTNADTAEDEKAKDEAAKAWLSRPVAGRTRDGKSYQLAGHDALMDCVMRNNSEALNRLLTVDKYDLDFSPRDGQWTLLQIALLHECVETTSLLLQHGANPNFASKGTPLPLELAQRSGRPELVLLVQEYIIALDNADPQAKEGESKEASQALRLDDSARNILQGFTGDWKLNAISFDGKTFGNVLRSKMSATIRGTFTSNNLEMFIGSEQMGPAYRIGFLDASITPMQITLNRYGTFQSLLSFEDEVLTLARPIRPGEPRPQSLQPAKGIVIYRWTRMSEQAHDRDSFVTIPLKAEWVPEDWLKRNMGRRHLTIVADGIIQDEAKPNVINRVQRGILHDCRLESYEKTSRDGVEYWNATFFVPRKPVYSIGALWFKDAIRNDRIGDRNTPVPSPDLTQDNPQLKLDETMKEGYVFRLDYVNDDFENNLPMVKSQMAESTSIQDTADSLVTITFTGTTDGASITASGIGWRVDGAGHILLPSNVVAECDDESIQLRFASGVRCSATRLKTLGHLTLLKSDQVVKGPAISLDSVATLTSGDAVSAILNGTDNVPGSIVKPRTTIALSELEGVKLSPELRFQNIITTDFVADETTLSGAPLLTKSGNVAGMIIRLGSAELIAIPVTEIREVLKQLQQVANFDPIRDHGLSTDSIEARTDGRFGILKIIEPTSLEDAVTKFNLLAKEHPLGLTQPGLSVEEMTAAFRLWIASDECNEATRKDFQQVLDTQMLRPGHILQFNTKFETDGHLFEVWSIQFGDDKSYAWFKIRDTKLLSRLKTDEERKAWEQRIDQMKKSFHEYKRRGDRPKAYDTNPADNEPKDATKDSAVTLPPMEFDTLEDFLKPGRELFDKEMKQIDERLAKVVEGSAEHSLLKTKKKQLQQQWDLSVAQVKGMAAAAKASKPVQLAPIVIPNNSRPWQAPMPDPLLGHDEDIAKVLAGTWDIKRFVQDGEEPSLDGSTTVSFSKNMMILHFKVGDEEFEIQSMYRIGNDKIDFWHMDSGPDIRTARPYLGSYSLENDTLRICYHDSEMELETPQSRPPVQPGKGFIYLELQRKVLAIPTNTQSAIPDTKNELDAKLVPLVSELADRVALGSIKTLVVEYEISHSRGAPVDLSQIESSFDTGSLARYSNYPAKLCLDRESGNGFFSGKDAYEFQIARNERIGKSLVHCENPVQATLLSPSDVTIRGQYAGYDKRVTNPFFNNRSLEDVLRDLIRGHDFLDEKSPKIWFRIVEDSDSLFRFEVVDHAVLEKVGNEIPIQDRERVAATYQVNIDRFQVTLDKRLNWAMTELVRYGCKSGQEGLEHGTAEIGGRIFFADHVLLDGVWLPRSVRDFSGYGDEVILMELAVTHLDANAPEQMINTLEFPPGSRVSDDRTLNEPEKMGLTEKVNVAPLAKLLTTWEEVEARVESIVKEREAILNADVDFKLDYAGNHSSKRRYHVWLNDLNRRSDCRGVSSDGTEDYSTIVTPTFGWFDDHQDKSNSQFHRRDPKDPVGWGTLGCIVDIRKVGLVNWSIESIDTHEFDENLLPKDRIETDVETGDCEGIPITIVKLKRKPDGVAESWTEYWLSPAHGNYPIYIASGWKESENSAEEYIVSQRTQWKLIDGVWFPTNVKHRYLCEQRKMDEIGTFELVTARLNVNPFPNVFDPLEDTGESDTSRKSQVEDPIASEPALGLAEKVSVAKGETGSGSYKISLLVLASDDLKPVSGATVDITLIRTDSGFSGDGGIARFKTDEEGIATIDNSLWPGRYQIQVRAPEGSRFRETEFSKDESILVVRKDGRYSPREFRLAVKDEK